MLSIAIDLHLDQIQMQCNNQWSSSSGLAQILAEQNSLHCNIAPLGTLHATHHSLSYIMCPPSSGHKIANLAVEWPSEILTDVFSGS